MLTLTTKNYKQPDVVSELLSIFNLLLNYKAISTHELNNSKSFTVNTYAIYRHANEEVDFFASTNFVQDFMIRRQLRHSTICISHCDEFNEEQIIEKTFVSLLDCITQFSTSINLALAYQRVRELDTGLLDKHYLLSSEKLTAKSFRSYHHISASTYRLHQSDLRF